MTSTLNAIETMNNLGVTHDVFKAMFMDDSQFINHLTLKHCIIVLPKA